LPEQAHLAFHANRLTRSQAIKERFNRHKWLLVRTGDLFRVFENCYQIKVIKNNVESPTGPLSPEEQLIADLVNLAMTIRDGQVNPLL
jgi:hypothetical protein